MNENIRIIGTVVQLKSGSPKMVVSEIINDQFVQCTWTDTSNPNVIHREEFNIDILCIASKNMYAWGNYKTRNSLF